MRYSKARKPETKQKIIESAYRLFSTKGFDATSIDEIMRDCALTRGGFYLHFRSKSQLYQEAVNAAARSTSCREPTAQHARLDSLLGELLTGDRTRAGQSHLALLATDVASEIPEVRAAYTELFRALSEQLKNATGLGVPCDDAAVLSASAMLVGALAVAQTTDDSRLRDELLESCREGAETLLLGHQEAEPDSYFWAPPSSHSATQLDS
jgi:TetR/AcrR family transcriptional regulator, transcriptional repressor for nem operon